MSDEQKRTAVVPIEPFELQTMRVICSFDPPSAAVVAYIDKLKAMLAAAPAAAEQPTIVRALAHEGCNYYAVPNTVCSKCGKFVADTDQRGQAAPRAGEGSLNNRPPDVGDQEQTGPHPPLVTSEMWADAKGMRREIDALSSIKESLTDEPLTFAEVVEAAARLFDERVAWWKSHNDFESDYVRARRIEAAAAAEHLRALTEQRARELLSKQAGEIVPPEIVPGTRAALTNLSIKGKGNG
jgi:hypothetical protein